MHDTYTQYNKGRQGGWPLVIAPEGVTCADDIKPFHVPADRCFVLIPANKTLQVFHSGRDRFPYEIDLERGDEDWLCHLSEKTWATPDFMDRLPSVCRQALQIVGLQEFVSNFPDFQETAIAS